MRPAVFPRYRIEGGKTCIDIKLRTAHQLFDGRDPAPFRERDLDEDAVEYLLGAVQELPAKEEIRIVFWMTEEPPQQVPDETVIEAVRAYFGYEVARLQRRLREHVRQGQITLAVGLTALTVFLVLAEAALWLPASTFRQVLREGLVITGWVALWRPIEVLLYDWRPLVRQRRLCERVVGAEIAVEKGSGRHSEPRPVARPNVI
jgi:hypothetical protein